MVFSGSVRHNLDPSHYFSDEKIYKIIQEVKYPKIILNTTLSLYFLRLV
jgi:hypothetical protein